MVFVARVIIQTLKGFGWRQWLLVAALVLVLGFTGLHVAHVVRGAIYWRQHRDEPIRSWMNLGYVAHSYRVPPHVLYRALDLPFEPRAPRDRRPLREIAKAQGRSMDEVRAVLQDAITHARPPHPPPPPPGDESGKP